ncbi:hypothetical protein ACMU6081_27285 [Achromobacter mucicolens]|uniref:Uncharacterized protein n=1 Tax=Achromobacter mucicolens TaxID=1389922 RepID=A0ABM8LHQ7_9BURK|nr:hypothetical protein LMG3415_04226 [Achromobacter mucicolens]
MKKRDLYAEIAEGFVALSRLRKGKTISCDAPVPSAGLAEALTKAREAEDLVDDSDALANVEIAGRHFLGC